MTFRTRRTWPDRASGGTGLSSSIHLVLLLLTFISSPPSDLVLYSPDRVYDSHGLPSRATTEPLNRSSSPRDDIPPGSPPPHTIHATPQPLPRPQTPPLPGSLTRTRFLTPPPTPAVNRSHPTRSATAGRSVLVPPPPGDSVSPHRRTQPSEYHPAPIITQPQRKHHTNIYPLLMQERMSHYFQMNDGIANRPNDGGSGAIVFTITY